MDDGPRRSVPRATLVLAALIVATWLATEWAGGSTNLDVLHRFGMRRALWVFSESPDRLVRSLFLHYGALHLTCNLLGLLSLGAAVEGASGPWAVLFLFFGSGLCGGMASMHWAPQAESVGASGAIYGLCGALLVLLARHPNSVSPHSRDNPRWRVTTGLALVVMVALGLLPRMAGIPVDVSNHVGGLAAGLLGGLALRPALDWRMAVPMAALVVGGVAWMTRGPQLPF